MYDARVEPGHARIAGAWPCRGSKRGLAGGPSWTTRGRQPLRSASRRPDVWMPTIFAHGGFARPSTIGLAPRWGGETHLRSNEPAAMPSHRQSRRGPQADATASDRPHFDAQDAHNWPFPETSGSPVWQAWRAARDLDRIELNKGWEAVGLRQVMATGAQRQRGAALEHDAGRCADLSHDTSTAAPDAVSSSAPDRARLADRLDVHFDAQLARRLGRAALETLGDLSAAHSSGRKWWALAPGIGPKRALEIVARVHSLLQPNARVSTERKAPAVD